MLKISKIVYPWIVQALLMIVLCLVIQSGITIRHLYPTELPMLLSELL